MQNEPQRYDTAKTYQWNYDHAPDIDVSPAAETIELGKWQFCGLDVDSPIGISAGPLLNGTWCLHYARLGFDFLTYKTVRSRQRDCYPPPHLQPIHTNQLRGDESFVSAADTMRGSWAVSFGMPSADPEVWRRDVEMTRDRLPKGKLLSVSVVGTMQDGWTIDDLAADYAKCARWAIQSGADCVETNFSCPNVDTCDGQLYQDPQQSQLVCQAVRDAIGTTPLIIKIGYVNDDVATESLLSAVGPLVDAIAMTNSIATRVRQEDDWLFKGQQRGICGQATRDASIQQVKRFADQIRKMHFSTQLIGVGGIESAKDARRYLDAGATVCHLATAAMLHPKVGQEIKRAFGLNDPFKSNQT